MFVPVDQKICKELRTECEKVLIEVQKELKGFFTFQFFLIGSGERKLVTMDDRDGRFDLDYNLVLMKDKQGLINEPKRIKELFLNAFNKANQEFGFTFANNSTSVITSKLKREDGVRFSFDCAIMYEGNNGNMYKIVFDKPDRYIWNELKNTKDFDEKYRYLLTKIPFKKVFDLYLEKKNRYKTLRIEMSSFSVICETVNDLIQNIR